MASRKPLVLNGGQIQRLQSGDYVDTSSLFDPASNLGGISGLATNGITVHNGTAYTTVSLTAPASGMTITNPSGVGGSPTFAFTGELSALIALSTGVVVKDASGTLAARTLTGTTNQITVTNGTGVSGNPTFSLASNPVLPGVGSVTVPTGTTGERPTGTAGMVRYNSSDAKFEFYENGAWVNYGTSNAVGTVTSVDVSLPTSVFSTSSGAVTTSGTISFTLAAQAANTVFAGPDAGGSATPTFRALVAADIPALDWTKITTGTPTTLAGYGITDAVPSSRTITAGTGLTGGGDLSANRTLSLDTVGTPVTAELAKITTDVYGRVTATSTVTSGDMLTLLGFTPLDKAGDTLTSGASLTFAGGGTVTGLPLVAVASTDAASKAYVDNVVASGTTWRDPVAAPNLMDIVTSVPSTPATRRQFIAYGGVGYPQTWGTLTDVAEGDLMEYQVSPVAGWVHIGTLSAGDRFTVAGEVALSTSSALYTAGFRRMDLIQYVSGDPTVGSNWTTPHDAGIGAVLYTAELTAGTATGLAGATTYTASVSVNGVVYPISILGSTASTAADLLTEITADLTGATASLVTGHIHVEATNPDHRVVISDTDLFSTAFGGTGMEIRGTIDAGTTVLVSNVLSQDNGRTGLFSGGADGNHSWVEIGGPTAINAGVGLVFDGNVLNVNLGAGIKELPSDEVGIDLRDTVSGALILTTDGTTRSTSGTGQLHLLLNGTTLVQGAGGLSVADGGITATQLATSVAGAGLVGGASTALSVNVDDSTLALNGDFVQVKAGGITETQLAASVAGNGLAGGNGTALSVNVDNSSIEISGDALRIKASGVTNTMLANSSITFAGTSGTPAATSLGGTFTIAAGTGVSTTASAGTVTVALNATLDNLTDVTITVPATGDLIYRNGSGQFVNGQPGATSGVQPYDTTLSALAQLSGTSGMVVETGVDAFVTRVLQGTAGRVVVTNGDGIASDPTVDLASGVVTAGTYSSVTVDTYGRVTAGSAVEASTQVSMVNAYAGSLTIGMPVYVSVAGSVNQADAGATSTTRAIGLVADTEIATTAAGNIAVAGILTATTVQWDAVVTGGSGGLIAGSTYFLEPGTAGKLTTTAPSGAGEYIAPLGIALSATKFKIAIDPTIQL